MWIKRVSLNARCANRTVMLAGHDPKRPSSSILHLPRSPLAGTGSRLALIRPHGVEHDLVGSLLGVGRVALAPIIADSVGEDVSVAVEGGAGDRPVYSWISLQAVLGVLIPEVESTVTSGSAECAVDGVEADRVDGVDVADVAVGWGIFTVALEGEVGGGILVLDVLDGAATFDTADGKSGGVGEAADYPRLPLEGGLHGLVEFGRGIKVHDVDITVRSADD